MQNFSSQRVLLWGCLLTATLALPVTHLDAQSDFIRGDSDQDGQVTLNDGISTLGFLFLGNPGLVPDCLDAADTDDDGSVQLTDAVSALGFLFLGSAPPAAPGPFECGVDPSEDALGCTSFKSCAASEPFGAFVTSLSINGGGSEAAVVPGDGMTLELTYDASNSQSCPTCIRQLVIGLDGVSLDCAFNGIPPVGEPISGEASFTTRVPNKAGVYSLYSTNELQLNCDDALALYAQPDTAPIGTIQVLTPRSKGGGVEVTVFLVNNTDGPLDLFFVDFVGVEQDFGTIEPDGEVGFLSGSEHRWHLRSDGRLAFTYVNTREPEQRVVFGETQVPNRRPVAVATGPEELVVPGLGVTLDGSGSSDLDDDTLTYSWELAEAPVESAAELFDATSSTATLGELPVGAMPDTASKVTVSVTKNVHPWLSSTFPR